LIKEVFTLAAEYILEMKNITKRYGENTVLSDVSLKSVPAKSTRCWAKTAQARAR